MQTKICTKCGKEFPATSEYFHRDKNRKDGLYVYCKECQSNNSRKHYNNNKKKYQKMRKEYRENNKEKEKERHNKYYRANKEKILERGKEYQKRYYSSYYQNNKLKKFKSNKNWRNNNVEKVQTYQQARQARIKGLPCSLTATEWKQVKDYFNHCCAYCGKQSKRLHQEHFIPLSKEGEYTKHNIIPACQSCNCSKQDKPFEEWYPEQPFYSKEREWFIYEHFTKMAEENGGWGRSRSDLGTLTIIIKEYQA